MTKENDMGVCQIILITIYVLGLGITLANHGKPKEGEYNFWMSLLSYGIVMILLWGGGFFK